MIVTQHGDHEHISREGEAGCPHEPQCDVLDETIGTDGRLYHYWRYACQPQLGHYDLATLWDRAPLPGKARVYGMSEQKGIPWWQPAAMLLLLLVLATIIALTWPSPAAATSAEATQLADAMTKVNVTMVSVNAGTITPAVAATTMLLIRDDDIGDISDYSVECIPAALYTWTSVDMLSEALAGFGTPEGYAWSMLAAALFLYPSHPSNLFITAMTECEEGL